MKTAVHNRLAQPIKIDSRRSSLSYDTSKSEPLPRSTKAQIEEHRAKVAKVVVGVLGAGLALSMLLPRHQAQPESKPTRDQATTCEIGPGTQEITFRPGDGKNVAILAIKGSGQGEGDPCWSEAEAAVDQALHGEEPHYDNKPVVIPREVHPIQTQNNK